MENIVFKSYQENITEFLLPEIPQNLRGRYHILQFRAKFNILKQGLGSEWNYIKLLLCWTFNKIISLLKNVSLESSYNIAEVHEFERRRRIVLGGVPPVIEPVIQLSLVYFSASQPDGGELGICGIVITVLSYILVIVTFPFSLFFCLKVGKWIKWSFRPFLWYFTNILKDIWDHWVSGIK